VEVATLIWEYLIEPRHVILTTQGTGVEEVSGQYLGSDSGAYDYELGFSRIKCTTEPPAVLHVNQASRQIGLSIYGRWNLHYSERSGLDIGSVACTQPLLDTVSLVMDGKTREAFRYRTQAQKKMKELAEEECVPGPYQSIPGFISPLIGTSPWDRVGVEESEVVADFRRTPWKFDVGILMMISKPYAEGEQAGSTGWDWANIWSRVRHM
jgi:hypothetical protein